MKCQHCEKPATFHITDLTGHPDPVVQELHLCEDHAREYLAPAAGENSATLAGVLAKQLQAGQTAQELQALDQLVCPVCGISFLEFRKQGRLGCPHDYVFFQEQLEPLLMNVHGATRHAGRRPPRSAEGTDERTNLIRLRRELKEAVQREDYERASQLRDEIRSLEQAES